jgi:hypothetical protein
MWSQSRKAAKFAEPPNPQARQIWLSRARTVARTFAEIFAFAIVASSVSMILYRTTPPDSQEESLP